jgi:phage terminase large subunit-like protein
METFEHYGGELKGQKFILTPWQSFVVYSLFGWKDKNGYRRFKYAYVEVAKKNGKTAFAALVAIFLLIMDGESAAEVYTFATKKDQARICFDDAKLMLDHVRARSVYMHTNLVIGKSNVVWTAENCKLAPLSADSHTQDGIRTHGGICDEFHAHPDDAMFNNVKSSMVNRRQPLMLTITTAGFDKTKPCYRMRTSCVDILNGKIKNDIQFVVIYTADPGDKESDPKTWAKANPSLGVPGCVTLKNLTEEYNDALTKGASQIVNFMTKNLNQWSDSSSVWITDKKWMKNSFGITLDDLKGQVCYGGLDIASGIDLNAFVLLFPNIKGKVCILPFFWLPADNAVENPDKNDYRDWINSGFIRTTPGNVIEPDVMVDDILNICNDYAVQSIGFDRKLAMHGIVQDLLRAGLECHELVQIITFLSEPTKEFERLVTKADIEHFKNPVLRWMMGNVTLIKDANNNIRIAKDKSKNKVDGPAATVNAIAEWMTALAAEQGDDFGVDYVSL